MQITIDVTAEDIRHGERNNCYECPVAIATKRAFHNQSIPVTTVTVEDTGICVLTGFGERLEAECNDAIVDFIGEFDIEEDEDLTYPLPFSTTLEFTEEE